MLTDIQQKLLQMMKELDQICRENGIHYTLGGGTAIGAIRHRGFIPWDDDIDLYMTRDNWEKFKAAEAAGKFPANRVIESAETDIGYTNTIGRYVTTDSSSVHSHQIISDDAAGHVIDVFVFDPLHIDNYREFFEDLMLYSDLMDETKSYSSRFDMNLKRYPEALARCEGGDKRRVIDELVESFVHMNDEGWQHYIMEWGIAPFLFPASIFDGGYIRVPFEDTTVEIVRNYGEYLIWQYGEDRQYIPEHEGREGHDAIFSNKIPYTEVRADYMPFINKDKVRNAYLRRKKRLLMANPHRRKADAERMKKKAIECREALLGKVNVNGIRSRRFEDYFSVQLSPEFAGRRDKHSTLRRYSYPVLVPIGEDLTVEAVKILMRTERMNKAKRLIDIYTGDFPENFNKVRRQSDRLDELNKEIMLTRELINDFGVVVGFGGAADVKVPGRNADALRIMSARLMEAYSKYPANSYILRLMIRTLMKMRGDDNSEFDGIINEMLGLLESLCPEGTPAHAEAEKFRADIEGADDDEYIRIYRETRNGCLRLEIEDLLAARGVGIPEEEPEEEPVQASAPQEEQEEVPASQAELEEQEIINQAAADEAAEASAEDTAENAAESAPTEEASAEENAPEAQQKQGSRYGFAGDVYRKIAGHDDRIKEEAWEIACRTRDRVVLLERYEGRLDELEQMLQAGEWDRLAAEMAPHREAVLRNLECGLGLCVHPRLQAIQYTLFREEGRADLESRIEALVPEQHRKPIREI